MRGVVDLGERLKVEMRVDLRGGNAGVPQQLLHGAQILRGLEQVGRERMAQHVRMHALAEPAAAPPRAVPPSGPGGFSDPLPVTVTSAWERSSRPSSTLSAMSSPRRSPEE